MEKSHIDVEFTVKTTTENGETVCVTGNAPELGAWKHQGAVPLRLTRKLGNGMEVWCNTISIAKPDKLEFRYLKAHLLEAQHEEETRDIMISAWETNIKPRSITFNGPVESSEEIHTFGTYDGNTMEDQGWLTGQTEVRLRLHTNPMSMWKLRYQQQTYRIKCTAVDLKGNNMPDGHEEESNHDLLSLGGANSVYVSVYRDDLMRPHVQPQFGTLYHENDYMVFRSQSFDKESQGYQFDFYVSHSSSRDGEFSKLVGSAYVLPANLCECGIKSVPINGLKHRPIGQLRVDYLLIKSMHDEVQDMSISYARQWVRSSPVDVGHRGLGSTYNGNSPATGSPRKCETVKENTIASLSEAGGHGAQYVEFDVHLTRDGIPVIYHDFVVGICLRQKNQQDAHKFRIPLHELTLEQLHMLQIVHADHVHHEITHHDHLDLDERPFPTLRQCFERIDQNVGFNVEIKYCMALKQGGLEDDVKHYQERNNYLNVILKEVIQSAGDRPVVFSCFDPDICSCIRRKQNKYPVLQLCNNTRPDWPDYEDCRTWKNSEAIAHCVSEGLLGVNPNTQDILEKPELVQEAKDRGLVVFCWGDKTNSKENIAIVKKLGVDGVIYDKIHELRGQETESVFEMENNAEGMALLTDVGAISPSNDQTTSKKSQAMKKNASAMSINGTTKTDFSGLIPKEAE